MVLVAIFGTACDDGGGEVVGTDATTSSSEAGAVTDQEAADTGSACTASEDREMAETAGTDDESAVLAGGLAFITDVMHDSAPCFQIVRFDFELDSPDTEVGYEVGYEAGPFEDVSGRAVAVEGEAFLRVVFLNGSTVDLSSEVPRETYTDEPAVAPGAPVVDIVKVSDFEGVSEWVIGLTEKLSFDVGGGADPASEQEDVSTISILIATP